MKSSTKQNLIIIGGSVIFSLQVAILGYWILGTPSKPSINLNAPKNVATKSELPADVPGMPDLNKKYDVLPAGRPAKGPANAPVTIVEFSDFECPFCLRNVPVLQQVESNYGDKVRVVFRQFPLRSIHSHAQKAAEASLCANEQHRFWEMRDLLFQEPRTLQLEDFYKKADSLHLNSKEFKACLDSGKEQAQIDQDIADGTKLGINGTPATYINGRLIPGAKPYEAFATIIDQELA